MKALGCHVFAGGFTMGVRQRADVEAQLEIHDFGRETVEKQLGLEFINSEHWEDWPIKNVDLLYGNPRCTGFSTMTSGYDDTIHGPNAKCTQDIWDLCRYGLKADIPVICWESVQQAWTVGRPLLHRLREELFAPAGYRIVHMFLNAATFGNAQQRKRYFFVAYRRDKNFNIVPPVLPERQTTVRDVIERFEDIPAEEWSIGKKSADYLADHYQRPASEDKIIIPHLRQGESLNCVGRREGFKGISEKYQFRWDTRLSDIPFSLHCHTRLEYDKHCPTMSGSCGQFVHPRLDRPLTVRELSALMGWPDGITPLGWNPTGQIAKGICPEVGVWLAEQVQYYVDDVWGKDDWSTRWNGQQWVGDRFTDDIVGPDEKIVDLTLYAPEKDKAQCITISA